MSEVDDWVVLFLNTLKQERQLSFHTIRAYRTDIEQFLNYVATQNLPFSDVRGLHVRMFFATLEKQNCSASLARKLATLRGFYKFLLRYGYVAVNPLELVKKPKITKKRLRVLTAQQLEAFLHAPEQETDIGKRDRAILQLLYHCGIKVGEAARLEMADLDFDKKIITIHRTARARRLLPCPVPVLTALQQYLTVRPVTEVPAFFLNRFHRGLSIRGIHRLVQHYAHKVGLPYKIVPQNLRYTWTEQMRGNGTKLQTLQELLGLRSLTSLLPSGQGESQQ